ncbi:MAG TPA: lipopolysaccharide biosynthesis protein [Herpetosiphonaceae bacterium]
MPMWRDALRANAIYAIGSLANSAALFVLIPYLIHGLTPEEYGQWSLAEISVMLLAALMLAGMDIGVMREYWAEPAAARRGAILGTALIGVAAWSLTVVAGGGLALAALAPGVAPLTGWLVLGIAAAEALWGLGLNILRIQERAGSFVALSLARLVVFIGLAVGLIAAGRGINGGLAGRLAATGAGGLALGALIWRDIDLRLDRACLRRILRYGLPLLPTNLALYVLLASDRYVLQHAASLETVAVYSFAAKIASVLDLAVTRPFAIDWGSRRFKIAAEADAPRRYARALTIYLGLAVGCALLIVALAPAVYRWVAPAAYASGAGIIPILLLGGLCSGLSTPLNVGIMIKNQTHWLPILGWGAAAVCLGLNAWWIPLHGMAGAAWATAASYAVWSGGIAWISQRAYRVPYSRREHGAILLLAGLGYAGLLLIEGTGLSLAAATGIKCAWIGILCAGGGYYAWAVTRTAQRQA